MPSRAKRAEALRPRQHIASAAASLWRRWPLHVRGSPRSHLWRVRDFKPIGRAARTISRVFPLRDNSFDAELGGHGEIDLAVASMSSLNRMPSPADKREVGRDFACRYATKSKKISCARSVTSCQNKAGKA